MKKKSIKEIVLVMPFFAVLFYMTIIGFIIPLRPTKSVSEKRYLDKFPTFSLSSFISGTYTEEISHWFADTFPGRESWINLNKSISSLHGFDYNYVDISSLSTTEEIPVVSPTAEPEAISESTPAPSSSIAAEPNTPAPVQTASPSPSPTPFTMQEQDTEFEEIDPDKIDIEIYSGAIQVGDTIYAAQGFSSYASENYVGYINSFADKCAELGINFYNVVAPTSVGVILPSEIRDQLNCADQEKALQYLSSLYSKNVKAADTYGFIKPHDNEYIYYHTDHHWTGLGAYYGYLAFCQSAGFSPVSLDEYTALDQGSFMGSFVSTAASSGKVKQDTVTAYAPPGDITLSIYNYDGTWDTSDAVVDKSSDSIYYKYNAYIGGDNMLSVITNADLPDAPDCLVIKDSFGNPFSVYLSQHYHNVYVIDYRKVTSSALEYAQLYGVEDVIVCQSIGVSQSNSANGLLGQVLRTY